MSGFPPPGGGSGRPEDSGRMVAPGPERRRSGVSPAGVILAAGASSRMPGRSKLLLPFRAGVVIEAVVRAAGDAGLDPVLVVARPAPDELRRALRGTGARVVVNRRHAEGQASSLARGIRAAEELGAPAAAVLLGDEPGVRPAAIRSVVAAWRGGAGPAVRAIYRDRPGHPVLFDRSLFASLMALSGDEGASPWIRARSGKLVRVEFDFPAPADVDTPADYDALRRGG